jgi:hypothetical protein
MVKKPQTRPSPIRAQRPTKPGASILSDSAFGASAGATGASWWGHQAPHVLIGSIVACIGLVLRPLPPGSLASVVAPSVLVAVVLLSWVSMRRHDRSLCEFCVAAMPINPTEAATRYRRRLALAHLGADRRIVVAYLVLLVGSCLLLLGGPPMLRLWGPYVWSGVQATMIYLVLSHTTHRRLQPWCPRCQDGGGEDHAVDPDPEPSGSRSR